MFWHSVELHKSKEKTKHGKKIRIKSKTRIELQKSKLKIKQGANIIKEARSAKIKDTLEKVNGASSKMMHISITKVHFHDLPLTHVKDRAFLHVPMLLSSSTIQTDSAEA